MCIPAPGASDCITLAPDRYSRARRIRMYDIINLDQRVGTETRAQRVGTDARARHVGTDICARGSWDSIADTFARRVETYCTRARRVLTNAAEQNPLRTTRSDPTL